MASKPSFDYSKDNNDPYQPHNDAEPPSKRSRPNFRKGKNKGRSGTGRGRGALPKPPPFLSSSATLGQPSAFLPVPQANALALIPPKKTLFSLYCGTNCVRELCDVVFEQIRRRDYRSAQGLYPWYCHYATTVAFCNRLVRIATLSPETTPLTHTSELRQAATGILLPSVLADYVEALGLVTTPLGIRVMPWVADYRRLFEQPGFVSPNDILRENGLPARPHWGLNMPLLTAWNQAMCRPAALSMRFRKIDYDTIDGKMEMFPDLGPLTADGFNSVYSPYEMPEVQAHLGAVYGYRRLLQPQELPGDTDDLIPRLFLAGTFAPLTFWADRVLNSFTYPNL